MLASSIYANDDKNDKAVKNTTSTESVEKVNLVGITGAIIDKKNNESLAGATIIIEGNKYYSDLDGNFSVSNLKSGKYTMKVELISYQPSEMEIDVQVNQKINIALVQQ